jgi:hypothetical protein
MAPARTTTKSTARDVAAEVAFLTRALKAPTLRESVTRLAERARAESWSHEEFLVACLQREVSARESHGGEGRIRAARFPARKSLEEFDFDHARTLKRDTIAHLGTLDFVTARENVVFLGSWSQHPPMAAVSPAAPTRHTACSRHVRASANRSRRRLCCSTLLDRHSLTMEDSHRGRGSTRVGIGGADRGIDPGWPLDRIGATTASLGLAAMVGRTHRRPLTHLLGQRPRVSASKDRRPYTLTAA